MLMGLLGELKKSNVGKTLPLACPVNYVSCSSTHGYTFRSGSVCLLVVLIGSNVFFIYSCAWFGSLFVRFRCFLSLC